MELSKAYSPKAHEDKIYKNWEQKKLFNPDTIKPRKKQSFSIVLPPPNVTGTLHLGHAAMLAIEDLMIRYKRMQGFDTLWVPGTDHAAIATQNVVEKKIYKEEKKTRHDLGREVFLDKVNTYAAEAKATIHNQLRKMGSSLDWDREAYTLDETRSKAVRKVFQQMYDDGLVYRGFRIVNWCPRCHTTLADDEIEYKDANSKLYWIKYGPFSLATTRPETKLGDTAVAVHPDDKRYKKMIGKKYMIPGVLGEFEVTVVADKEVDPEFGSGAVKVTPGHSMLDYEIAQRNDLPMKKIINEDGKMMENCGKYAGMTTADAREAIVKDMKKMNLIEKVEDDYENKLSVCYRCKSQIEPLPSKQWFVDVNKKYEVRGSKMQKIVGSKQASLKQVSIAVVKNADINIIPERFKKTYLNWMENLHDWCVSRQIWFGHRIPVYYKKADKPVELTFLRHAQSEANLAKEASGRDDCLLTEKGIEDAKKLGEQMKNRKFDVIISSPLKRAKQTAEFVYAGKEYVVDDRLIEIDFGKLTRKGREEVDKFREVGYPGGETYQEVVKRLSEFLGDLIDKYEGKKVAIVAHSNVWKPLEHIINNQKLDYKFLSQHYVPAGPVEFKLKEVSFVSEDGKDMKGLEQDEDTLDTWFSSGLWTFTTMLPQDWNGKEFESKDIERFHPTTVLETGYDIIFFWVARMILMTTYVMGEVPFENVYLHGLIRDKDGDKMSKSKPETAIDPVEAGEKYGFDATRLSLLIGNTAGNDIRLYDEKIAGYRNFVNKLWNVSRFILMNVEDTEVKTKKVKPKTLADKWILSRFNTLKANITKQLDEYNFSQAGDDLKEFTWNELADWYLEIAKVEKNKDAVLMSVLKELLQMWHPYVPFVTEAIWGNLNQDKELMISEWPEVEKRLGDDRAEAKFELLREIVVSIRNLRAEYKVEPAKKVNVMIDGEKSLIKDNMEALKSLARLEKVEFVSKKPDKAAASVVSSVQIYLPLADLVDAGKEKERLDKEIINLNKYLAGLESKLKNDKFVKSAPAEIVEAEKQKQSEAREKLAKLEDQLKDMNQS